jgi:hypothetical protein
VINEGFASVEHGGSIPPNVLDESIPTDLLKFGNNAANDRYTMRCKEAGLRIHPARFPAIMPEFFIKMLTDPEDIVIDPFAGSNTTGMVAEALERRWLAVERDEGYLEASKFRFEKLVPVRDRGVSLSDGVSNPTRPHKAKAAGAKKAATNGKKPITTTTIKKKTAAAR